MNKKIFTLFLMILSCFMLQAQIRSFVGIVRPAYHDDTINFLETFKDDLKKEGYKDYAKYIESYLKGGFGSGFVYVDAKGRNYIITNRHVIAQGDSVTVEFENEDGSSTTFKNLKILLADEDLDLAILSFENNEKPFKIGIPLSEGTVQDGNEIWTAGFPALGNEPLWQLGKGSVTNSRAKVKDLVDPEVSTLIQHSAQIDSGNSGGPLLISASNKCGYTVVGINTWKVVNRQDTNYAIPSKVIIDFISKATNPDKSITNEAAIKSRAQKFAIDVSKKDNTFVDIVKYISYDYVSKEGTEAFKKALKNSSVKIPTSIVECFAYSPIEGMRYALAYLTWLEFHNKEDSTISIPEISELTINDENIATVLMTIENAKKPVKLLFAKEYGNWQIDYVNDGVEFASSFLYFPSNTIFDVEYDIGLNKAPSGVSLGFKFGRGLSIFGGKVKIRKLADNYYDSITEEFVNKAAYAFGLYFQTGLIFPMNFKTFYIMPYLQGEAGIWMTMVQTRDFEKMGFDLGGILGCYFGPEFDWPVKPLLNVAYSCKLENFKPIHYISTGVSIAF